MAGKVIEGTENCWHMRPIAPVAPAVEAVKCPCCSVFLYHQGGDKWACENGSCDFNDVQLPLATWKRLTIAPEPLRCPVCNAGAEVGTYIEGAIAVGCLMCGLRGPDRKTPAEAEAVFRQLRYEVKP
jgi:hypothetical protein